MNILLALVPAIGWGVQPLILEKVGSGTNNEILGTGIGAIIVGILVEVFTHPSVSLGVFLLILLSVGFLVLGQIVNIFRMIECLFQEQRLSLQDFN